MGTIDKIAAEVAAERKRQVGEEGWSREHDDQHDNGDMAWAAACYAAPDLIYVKDERANATIYKDPWPWEICADKRAYIGNSLAPGQPVIASARRRRLVQSAALIMAEIERLDRIESQKEQSR